MKVSLDVLVVLDAGNGHDRRAAQIYTYITYSQSRLLLTTLVFCGS